MSAQVQSQNGLPINLYDFVRIPNPQAGQQSYAYGMVSALQPGAQTVTVTYLYNNSGTVSTATATVNGNTVLGMGAYSGPGNAESNRGI